MNAHVLHPLHNRCNAGGATAAARTACRALVLLATAAALAGPAGSAWAASQSFNGIGAGGIDADNNGTFDTIVTGALAYATGRDAQGQERRWAIEFNLAALPAGAVIDSASLSLRTANAGATGQVTLNGYAGDGSITVGDMVSGSSLLTFTVANSTLIPYDVSSFVQGTYSPAQSWLGFNLRQTPLEATGSGFGDTWNGPDNFPQPSLTVHYTLAPVPEPAAALLLVLGLGVVLRAHRRRPAAHPPNHG